MTKAGGRRGGGGGRESRQGGEAEAGPPLLPQPPRESLRISSPIHLEHLSRRHLEYLAGQAEVLADGVAPVALEEALQGRREERFRGAPQGRRCACVRACVRPCVRACVRACVRLPRKRCVRRSGRRGAALLPCSSPPSPLEQALRAAHMMLEGRGRGAFLRSTAYHDSLYQWSGCDNGLPPYPPALLPSCPSPGLNGPALRKGSE